jgi:hypothetical protein
MNEKLLDLVAQYNALANYPKQSWQDINANGWSQTARKRRTLVFEIAEAAYEQGEPISTAIVKQKDEESIVALRKDKYGDIHGRVFIKAIPPIPLPRNGDFYCETLFTWLDSDGKYYWMDVNTNTWQLCIDELQFEKLAPRGLEGIDFDLLEI